MRTWLDHYTKSCLRDFLEATGEVELQQPVASVDPQWIDVWYEPKSEQWEERVRLGWLGRLAEQPCMFEPYTDAPDEEEVKACLRKVFTKHHRRVLEAKKAGDVKITATKCWIIAPSVSASMIRACGLSRNGSWPEGIYEMPSIVGLGWISLRHLPRTADTLSLRLLAGRGRIFEEAMEDIDKLPEGAWEKNLSKQIFLARYEEVNNNATNEAEAQEFIMTAKERYEQWEKQKLELGMRMGLVQGVQQGLEKGMQQGREAALRSALISVFQSRFGKLPPAFKRALDNEHNSDVLFGYMPLFSVESPERIAQALGLELSSAHS